MMTTEPDRTSRLEADLRALGAPPDHGGRDRWLTLFGVLLLAAGIVVAIVGYAISATTSDPLRQSDGRALGPVGITLSIAGAALFLRYSTTRFLRFWLARLVHTQTAPPPNP
jgi:drug/metabolite transporter (DMT)-like permease